MSKITYDSKLSKIFYEVFDPLVKDRSCPYCPVRLNINNFGGIIILNKKPRFIHKNPVCLSAMYYDDSFQNKEILK